MAHSEATLKSEYVIRTRRHLEVDLQLERLLELTYGYATPGSTALALVVHIIAPCLPTRWDQLALSGLSADAVLRLADHIAEKFYSLVHWSAMELDSLLDALAVDACVPTQALRQVVSIFVLRSLTPLPLPEVLEVIGRDECLLRLLECRQSYHACQLIG